jgi:hypothetical protein
MAAETASGVAAGLVAKLTPAGIGALIMVAVGPKTITRQEIFLRAFVALGATYLFSDAVASYVMANYAWFDAVKHRTALDGLIGCVSWGMVGGANALLQRFKRKPLETFREVRDTLKDKQ